MDYPLSWLHGGHGDFAAWRQKARARGVECLLTPPPAAPFEPKVIAEQDRGSYVARKVVFNVTGDSRVLAFLLVPKSAGPHPAVLLVARSRREVRHRQGEGHRAVGRAAREDRVRAQMGRPMLRRPVHRRRTRPARLRLPRHRHAQLVRSRRRRLREPAGAGGEPLSVRRLLGRADRARGSARGGIPGHAARGGRQARRRHGPLGRRLSHLADGRALGPHRGRRVRLLDGHAQRLDGARATTRPAASPPSR